MSCLATKIIRRHAMSFISVSHKYEYASISLKSHHLYKETLVQTPLIECYYQTAHTHTHTHTNLNNLSRCFIKITTLCVPPQEMQDNVKKCKNFLATLIKLASHNSPSPETSKNVKSLVQDLLVRIERRMKNNCYNKTSSR